MRRSLIVLLVLLLAVAVSGCAGLKGNAPGGAAATGTAALAGATRPAGTPAPVVGSGGMPTALALRPTVSGGQALPTLALPATPVSGAAGPTAQAQPANCTDKAAMTADVTVPDDTVIPAGQSFVKTWRLKNTGTCTWTTGYALVFANKGEAMNAPASVPLPSAVAPNATVDVSVSMVAPAGAGTHKGNWQMRNVRGDLFGIGTSDGTFWAQIITGNAGRITAPVGGSGTAKATLTAGVPSGYVVRLSSGQKATVTATGDVSMTVLDPETQAVQPAQTAGKLQWDFSAAKTGDYVLVLRGSGTVNLTVAVK